MKKILTLLTLFVVVLGVSACGGSSLPSEYTLTFNEETLKTNGNADQDRLYFDVVVGKDIKLADRYTIQVTPKSDVSNDVVFMYMYYEINDTDRKDFEPITDIDDNFKGVNLTIPKKLKDGDYINIIFINSGSSRSIPFNNEDLDYLINNLDVKIVAE